MSEYRLDINGNMELSDYSSIQDYMRIIGAEDKVTISMKDNGSETKIICNMLKRENFNIQSVEEHKDGKYYIKVSKTT